MTKDHGPIIGMFGGCHRGNGFIAGSITYYTTWPWRWFRASKVSTHSSIGFIYANGYREIYEAREGQSWQGPIPIAKVRAWQLRKKKKRRFTMYDIPAHLIDMVEADKKHDYCESKLGVWSYSLFQLPRMGIRKYLPFLPINATPDKVVCSEAATIILGPQLDVCKIMGKRKPDLVTPFDFEQAMKSVTKKREGKLPDVSEAYAK